MSGIISKIKEYNLTVESFSFVSSRTPGGGCYAELMLENSKEGLCKTALKKIKVASEFNTKTNEDDYLDSLFAIAGFDTNNNEAAVIDSPLPQKEEQGQTKDVNVAPVPAPPQQNGFSMPSMPPMPGASTGRTSATTANYSKPQAPVAPKEAVEPPEEIKKKQGGIRDVQMLAIQAMIKIKKTSYEELVKAAFEENKIECDPIPAIENLTETQALEVIRYGNNKYKNQ